MKKEDTAILKENQKRLDILFAHYDPTSGEGSLIERFPFFIYHDLKPIKLPIALKEKYGSIKSLDKDFLKLGNPDIKTFHDAITIFEADRIKNDFEYWAFTCVKIKPKQGGDHIPFKLNRPQRRLVKELERMRLGNKPIRLILCKCRQWGGSTCIQIYASWIQMLHKTNWNSMIAAHVNGAANNIRFMYKTVVNEYPKEYGTYTWSGFEGTNNTKMIKERNCKITVGSMQTPDSIRSEDISISHCSEVGLWKKTLGKEPKDLIQSISGSIPEVPYSMFILESTAKGTGNYFHKTWMAASKPKSSMTPFFVPWHETEMDTMNFESDEEMIEFYHSMDEYEIKLWSEFKATLEGIKWYRYKFNSPEIDQDVWRMNSENPSSVEEAFQATGRKVHPPHYIATLKENLRNPILIGDIFGNKSEGKGAFEKLRIEKVPKGNLKLWAMPNNPPLKENEIAKGGRYAMFVDIGGKSHDADYSVISGFDRYWMAKGGEPERVFTWRGHIDHDLLAWKAAQLGRMFNDGAIDALLAFEMNTYSTKHSNTEGDHAFTIIDTLADYYDNLFTRTNPDSIKEGIAAKWGFHTNPKSKGMLVDNFNRLLRLNYEAGAGYIEYDERAYEETEFFEHKDDGNPGAVDGEKDDVYMTTAGGLWLCTSYMEPFQIVKKDPERVYKKQSVNSAARF